MNGNRLTKPLANPDMSDHSTYDPDSESGPAVSPSFRT